MLSNQSCNFSCLVHSGFNAEGDPVSQGPSVLWKATKPHRGPAIWTALASSAISARDRLPRKSVFVP